MIVYPNAKINIGLNIIGKRSDGFHDIESCFFPIDLCDILEIQASDSNMSFQSSGISIPGNEDKNLCVKAWKILHKAHNIPSVTMHLHKQIPIGAGLGGGSADGAFAIKALAELFNLKLNTNDLEHYAAELGSDCAFFINNSPAFAEGRGEILSPISCSLSEYHKVIVNPGIHIGTAEAYAGVTSQKPNISLKELISQPIEKWQKHIKNDFEPNICQNHPEIGDIKNKMLKNGADYAAMSGSGSSVFGLFKNKPSARLKKEFSNYFIWQGK